VWIKYTTNDLSSDVPAFTLDTISRRRLAATGH
jgi:hypothetical protein